MRLVSLLSSLIMTFVFAFSCTLEAAELSVNLKQLSVKQGVPFVLTLELRDGDDGLVNGAEPDLSSLSPAFTLVATRRASFADFTDGGLKTGIRWQLTLKTLASGKLEIPVISLGTLKTQVIAVEVAANAQLAEVADPAEPILKAQLEVDNEPVAKSQPVSGTLANANLWWWLLAPLGGWLGFSYWRQVQRYGNRMVTRLGWWIDYCRWQIDLYQACCGDNPQRVKGLLLAWGGKHHQGPGSETLGQLAEQLSHRQLSAAIMQLDRCLYAKSPSLWRGAELWLAFKSYRHSPWLRPGSSNNHKLLPLLYPRFANSACKKQIPDTKR